MFDICGWCENGALPRGAPQADDEITDLRAKLAAAEAREAVMVGLVDGLIAASTQSRAVLNDAIVKAKVVMGSKADSAQRLLDVVEAARWEKTAREEHGALGFVHQRALAKLDAALARLPAPQNEDKNDEAV